MRKIENDKGCIEEMQGVGAYMLIDDDVEQLCAVLEAGSVHAEVLTPVQRKLWRARATEIRNRQNEMKQWIAEHRILPTNI